MTMFHTDVSLSKRPSTAASAHLADLDDQTATLSRSTRYLLHALRNRLVVVTAAAEMLDPVSTGPDSPAWTWGGTLRDEVISLGHTLDSLEATLPSERRRVYQVMLAQELTASTIRLFKKFGLSGRGTNLPSDQDIAILVQRPSVGTLFDMIWSAQVSSADAAKLMKLSITKEAEVASVRIVSPIDNHIVGEPINQEALECVRLIATNLGADLDMTIEVGSTDGERLIVSHITFSTVEEPSRRKKS